MDRRTFLKGALSSSLVYGAGGIAIPSSAHAQNGFAPVNRHTVINVMTKGGPDWRHVMPPAFSNAAGSVGNAFWKARSRAYDIADSESAMNQHWSDEFHHRSDNGIEFGILKSCDWLAHMYDEGNVAVVCNVVGSQSRDHLLSELVLNQGNRTSGPNDFGRSGWGGRLASVTDTNILGLSSSPSPFGYGLHPSGDINQYYVGNHIGIRNTRKMGLYQAKANSDPRHDARGNVTTALETFYMALRQDMAHDSPYTQFLDHEFVLREFGALLNDRLNDVPEPDQLAALYGGALNSKSTGIQMRNLYDALACNDVLNWRVASMEVGGWDTHDGQATAIEKPLTDLFGKDKGFDTLWQQLPGDARDNTVFVIAGEFGRQLVANGAGGTDHGRGTSYLVIGNDVRGGIYGDQFPEQELARHDDVSPDITAQTEFDHVLSAVSDWFEPGVTDVVFPDRHGAMLEAGVNLTGLIG